MIDEDKLNLYDRVKYNLIFQYVSKSLDSDVEGSVLTAFEIGTVVGMVGDIVFVQQGVTNHIQTVLRKDILPLLDSDVLQE
jgi:hypothetical protein